MQICKILNAELSFGTGSCLKCAGPSFGSCKTLEVVIAEPLFANRIILLGVFGLQKACTSKINALQLSELKNMIHTRNAMSALIVLQFVFAEDSPIVIVTR
jgi:hypothetical protein